MRKYFRYVIPAALLAVLLLGVSTTSSPAYGILMGNYQDNPVFAHILAGLGIWQGKLPYRDLFSTAAPLHLLILGCSYRLGGRILLFFMQLIHLLFFGMMMYRMVRSYKKSAVFFAFAAGAGIFLCLCSGGNSAEEWSLGLGAMLLWLLMSCEGERSLVRCSMIGLVSGLLVLVDVECLALVLGGAVFLFVSGKFRSWREWALYLAAFLLPIGLVVVIAARAGCLLDFYRAMVVVPVGLVLQEGLSVQLLLHKAAKCLLMGIPVLLVLFSGEAPDGDRRKLLACMAGAGFLGLLLGSNAWNRYLLLLPVVMLAMAMLFADGRRWVPFVAACSAFLLVVMPGKNYLSWLWHGTDETAQEFADDLAVYLLENPTSELFFLDSDCAYLLNLGMLPERKYFYQQTDFAAAEPLIGEEVAAYLGGAEKPECMVKSVYGMYHEDDYQGYLLVAAYVKPRGNLQIYLATE